MATHKQLYKAQYQNPVNSQLWLPGEPASNYTAATDAINTADLATGLYLNAASATFDGSTTYGLINLAAAFKTANVSIGGYFRPTSVSALQNLISAEPIGAAAGLGVQLQITASGKAQFGIGTGSSFTNATGATTLSTNTWYHIIGTYDGTNAKVYVNGAQDNSTASAAISWTDGSSYPTPASLFLGAWKANSVGGGAQVPAAQFFGGQVSELWWFNVALTATQVASLYNAGLVNNLYLAPNLVAWWPCADGSGTTIADQSGNANNVTFSGTTAWSTALTPY